MIIVTTLVIPPGGDAGPFDLYSDADGYTTPFATGVSALQLQTGYSSTVPDNATSIKVVSVGICTNFIILDIDLIPPTTTTTSSSSTSTTTSTSTSTSTSTTTSTTTAAPVSCNEFQLVSVFPENIVFNYIACNGTSQSVTLNDNSTTVCAQSVTPPAAPTNKWEINIGVECTSPTLCSAVEIYPPLFNPGTYHVVNYIDCASVFQEVIIPDGGTMITICPQQIISDNGNGFTNPTFALCSI